ncbi:undecaprenyl/decaprenyl-phosphate alpha-N-acetylglucosaminyl 1-phosphate transferase [Sediminibacterium roseum]|uniref:Undecaprenyl/decaprenyl-phosphate alpha-N-acetylglucosaminyl 1-phosphate transferase n=1 Tax=Sediminibacterium roseum TaxID=1978412 RepID=A0ABW9ZRH1_9BACT|nr:MraY family glycosyltransferase [Sediminibacterium roseum]NCI49110.1 undecaprenyl/decaprenyl-phosphate alpha-N-acetylglucosaminyl 1-phosphate transferase [Sediminibacterium roseum]
MLIIAVILFLTALLGTMICIRSVISIAREKHLFDEPSEERKIHIYKTPNLGGVGIYCAFMFSASLVIPLGDLPYFNCFVAASLIIFAIGLKDDLVGLGPTKKFLAQIAAAAILAFLGDLRFTSFHGLFGVTEISYPLSILVTILINIFIYNAINLIDGIDGLAGSLGLIGSLAFAVFFFMMKRQGECLLAIGFAGSLIGFLYYNISPAKTFMGDTGSLLVGFMLSMFCVRFVELNKGPGSFFPAAPSIAFAILLVPIVDTVRVFMFRALRGRSPFVADSNHLHHRFINMGFTHMQTTGIIVLTNIIFISAALVFQNIGNAQLISFLVLFSVITNFFFWNLSKSERRNANVLPIDEKIGHDEKLSSFGKNN